MKGCAPLTWCGAPQDYGLPLDIDDPLNNINVNFGYTTFDNIGKAALTIFTVLVFENWDYTMYNLMNSSNPYYVFVYFILIVLFGSFLIMNLIIAVFMNSFAIIDEEDI